MNTIFFVALLSIICFAPSCSAIIAGQPAGLLSFTYVVSVQQTGLFGTSHICGGSIIGSRTVLTAARCCKGSATSSLQIRYGSKSRTSGGSIARATQIIIHPDFNSNTDDHDYCILHVTDIDFLIGPSSLALLPELDTPLSDVLPVQIAGWGVTTQAADRKLPDSLQAATLQTIDSEECAAQWQDTTPITATMRCAAPSPGENPATSECRGDEGGPLADGTGLMLLGLGSFTDNCSATPKPNVFADVRRELSWIRQNTV